jgi:hypothetical protein
VCSVVRGKGATKFDSAGRLLLKSKDHIQERLRFSPDIGDAAALTFALDFNTAVDESERPRRPYQPSRNSARQLRDGVKAPVGLARAERVSLSA